MLSDWSKERNISEDISIWVCMLLSSILEWRISRLLAQNFLGQLSLPRIHLINNIFLLFLFALSKRDFGIAIIIRFNSGLPDLSLRFALVGHIRSSYVLLSKQMQWKLVAGLTFFGGESSCREKWEGLVKKCCNLFWFCNI